jgi:chemotaxis protein MotB
VPAHGRRSRHAAHEEEHENEERWLVSYADMMTLLFCLFMVLFAISSVNTSKFQALSKALQNAFSGRILSGGRAVMQTGSDTPPNRAAAQPPLPSLAAIAANASSSSGGQQSTSTRKAQQEQEEFKELKRRIDALARQQGVASHVQTSIRANGLVVALLTDGVFFDSGSASLNPPAVKLLHRIGQIVAAEARHPVSVEGFTDAQPISTPQYPSNWQLSGARSGAVIQNFVADGVLPRRMSLVGYAAERPTDTNATAAGRARNRRVDVVLTRLYRNAEIKPSTP